MSAEPAWLSLDDLIAINRTIVAATGEPHHIIDPGGLDSSRAKPINHWHYGETDIIALAVELCLGIARNHCFAQRNKRTAFAALDIMLAINGYRLAMPDTQASADMLVAVITRDLDDESFVALVDRHVVPLDD